jgi:hypothetical protein
MIVTATAYKQTTTSHVGIKLWATPDGKQIVIVFLDDHCIFSRSGLKVGMRVDRVNDVHCSGKTLSQVNRVLDEAVGSVTILASPPGIPDPADLPEIVVVESYGYGDDTESLLSGTSDTDSQHHPLMATFLDTLIDYMF